MNNKKNQEDNFQVQLEFEKTFFSEIPVKVTPQQEIFCQQYIKCGNASKAYKIAFSDKAKDKSIWESASRLKNKTNVMARLAQLHAKAVDMAVMTSIDVLKELTKIAQDNDEDTKDRIKSLELIGKHHNLFKEPVDALANVPLASEITVKFVGSKPNEKNK